jgi:hypothetical protein
MSILKKVILLLVLGIIGLPLLAQAEDFYRTDKMDIYLKYANMQQKQLDFNSSYGTVPMTLDYTNLWGFGFARHLDQGLEANFELMWGNTTLRGKQGTTLAGVSSYTFVNTGTLNLNYNFLKKKLTPFVTGGFGWQYMEAQGRDGIYVPGYWDPWYGYIPGYYTYPVYYETDFMWNTGLGVRFDVTENFFIKAFAEVGWVYYRNINGPINMPKYGIVIGGSY